MSSSSASEPESGYEQLMRAMDEAARTDMDAVVWQAEISEQNYQRLCQLATLIEKVDETGCVTDAARMRIQEIGTAINAQGGFQAMQAVYYTLFNFICETADEKANVRSVDAFWDGIGEWMM
jgi:hypothetical protein